MYPAVYRLLGRQRLEQPAVRAHQPEVVDRELRLEPAFTTIAIHVLPNALVRLRQRANLERWKAHPDGGHVDTRTGIEPRTPERQRVRRRRHAEVDVGQSAQVLQLGRPVPPAAL